NRDSLKQPQTSFPRRAGTARHALRTMRPMESRGRCPPYEAERRRVAPKPKDIATPPFVLSVGAQRRSRRTSPWQGTSTALAEASYAQRTSVRTRVHWNHHHVYFRA